MDIFSILFGLFEEKDGEKILKIIGILFQYLFNISVPSIVLCIQCKRKRTLSKIDEVGTTILSEVGRHLTGGIVHNVDSDVRGAGNTPPTCA